MSARWTRARVLAEFGRWEAQGPERSGLLDAEARDYVAYHATRYARLLDAVRELVDRLAPRSSLHLLDVGPNIQTGLFRSVLPEATVDTLGFANPAVPPREDERHAEFDLNQSSGRAGWPVLEREYDLIVLAEVLEHLHVPPHTVLEFLAERLRRPGYIVIQTPNAAALHKRMALLAGRNPIEPPRVCQRNPGHFHEYTVRELRDQVRASGLTIEWLRTENYFGSGTVAELYRTAGHLMPATWRHGVTLCVRAGD
jgi:SAM-dependent methyltransferase